MFFAFQTCGANAINALSLASPVHFVFLAGSREYKISNFTMHPKGFLRTLRNTKNGKAFTHKSTSRRISTSRISLGKVFIGKISISTMPVKSIHICDFRSEYFFLSE